MKRKRDCWKDAEEQFLCRPQSLAREIFDRAEGLNQLERGEEIFQEGDVCRWVHVLCSGRVKLLATGVDGRRLILKIARPGELLGLSAALTSQPQEMTAQTLEPCRVKTIRTEALLGFLAANPDANMAAARILAQDYKEVWRNLKRLTLPASVAARVANLLLDWTQEPAPGNRASAYCLMPLTHEEMAMMIASTRETVTRILGRLKRDRVISFRGAILTVLQPQTLEQLAN